MSFKYFFHIDLFQSLVIKHHCSFNLVVKVICPPSFSTHWFCAYGIPNTLLDIEDTMVNEVPLLGDAKLEWCDSQWIPVVHFLSLQE